MIYNITLLYQPDMKYDRKELLNMYEIGFVDPAQNCS